MVMTVATCMECGARMIGPSGSPLPRHCDRCRRAAWERRSTSQLAIAAWDRLAGSTESKALSALSRLDRQALVALLEDLPEGA